MIADCPFCGNTQNTKSKDGLHLTKANKMEEIVLGAGWRVKCPSCEALGPRGDLKSAVGQWNCWWDETQRLIEKAKTSSERPATHDKKCGHGPEMLKVVDLYCAQCVKEAK